ncbi:hypothetical protein CEXT_587681 [Caerostris extrusa]|uniref:Uncharacterized protein n=1 Tax=Caerostris extrusa TaxID=172846 RepID=A0AAV4Y5L1_CAEEX|nr:hypothetical protein CEXT_587681 [Caerostris extrusa]
MNNQPVSSLLFRNSKPYYEKIITKICKFHAPMEVGGYKAGSGTLCRAMDGPGQALGETVREVMEGQQAEPFYSNGSALGNPLLENEGLVPNPWGSFSVCSLKE